MIRSFTLTKAARLAVAAAFVLAPIAANADEVQSTSVQSTSAGGSSSTHVQSTDSVPGATTSKSYKAEVGPGGAHISKTKDNVQANGDGSVSSTREHESHTMSDAGDTHHRSAASTTVGADGSTSSVKSDVRTSTP